MDTLQVPTSPPTPMSPPTFSTLPPTFTTEPSSMTSSTPPSPPRGRTPVQDSDRRAAARSRSRFQEGSMNDRVSAVPPPHFLGPDDDLGAFASPSSPYPSSPAPYAASAYNTPLSPSVTATTYASSVFRRGVSRSRSDESCDRHRRPISAAGETISDRSMRSGVSGVSSRTFFNKPWLDNIRGMLAGKTPSQQFQHPQPFSPAQTFPPSPQASPRPEQKATMSPLQQGQFLRPPPPYRADDRPSREEIMKGYKELMASDFFASRAIASTRQPPPGARFPPPAPSSGAASSAASICSSASPRPQQPQAFPADLLATLNGAAPAPRPRPRPQKERPSRPTSAIITRWPLSPRGSMDVGSRPPPPGRHSIDGYAPNRGSTRPRFIIRDGQVVELPDDDDGVVEPEPESENNVGHAIKRLRKSASRLSVELPIPRLRRSTSDSPSPSTPVIVEDGKPRKHHRLAKLVIGARFSRSSGTPIKETPTTASTPTCPLSTPSPFGARGPASRPSSSFASSSPFAPSSLANSSLAPPKSSLAPPSLHSQHSSSNLRPLSSSSRWATPRASMDPLAGGISTVPELPEHNAKTRMSVDAPRKSFSMTPSVRSRTDGNMCFVRTTINMEDVMMLG